MDAPTIDNFRQMTETVAAWPESAQVAVELFSEAGLVALALLVGLSAWRRRSRGPGALATVLVGSAGAVMAYGLSEVLKLAERQARPCQALSSVESLVTCPPAGDWSLPSNHATIAAALAAIVIVNRSRLAPLAVLLAVGVAVSRVALGVHYPHDVTTGLLLGTLVVVALTAALVPRTSRMLEAAAGHRLLGHRSD